LRTGQGTPSRTFRLWMGDDCDATTVGDDQGFLYVGCEVDRALPRGTAMGQLLKIDPRQPDDPVVWRVDVNKGKDSGTWSTPAIIDDVVVWPTKQGIVYGLDRTTGLELWRINLSWGMMSSPVIVDRVLVQASSQGVLHAYDVTSPRAVPTELWQVQLPANIESTPAVWKGRIYVGTRDGYFYAVGDA
jgi:outer membrane protein assembly factor BamB